MRIAYILLLACGAASVAAAQALPAGLRACAAEPDNARRLACYDREMARAAPAVPVQESAPVASAPAVSPPTEFGLSEQRLRVQEGKVARKELTAHVTKTTQWQNGRQRVTLDNDQVWEQTEDDWGFNPQPGATATITSGVLGGFWMATDAYKKVRVKRIR